MILIDVNEYDGSAIFFSVSFCPKFKSVRIDGQGRETGRQSSHKELKDLNMFHMFQ